MLKIVEVKFAQNGARKRIRKGVSKGETSRVRNETRENKANSSKVGKSLFCAFSDIG